MAQNRRGVCAIMAYKWQFATPDVILADIFSNESPLGTITNLPETPFGRYLFVRIYSLA